eukprot:TRINITY_DN6084_c1_g1_i1.p1 TRINITY_DN6084_c1_g1~~TRINITY_DN6084_c1_g1_i1.p1  ORF type:complete len:401 (+),score=104.80 TRINITY_DN6084_c1_g1_i1:176-1378(+)
MAAPQPPPLPAHIQTFADQIRSTKESLKAQGLSNKQLKNHPQLAGMVAQLDQMKTAAGINPKTNFPFSAPKVETKAPPQPQPIQPQKALPPELQGLGNQLKAIKNSLKMQGLSADQIKKHPHVAALSDQLNNAMKVRSPPPMKTAPSAPQPYLPPQVRNLQNQLDGMKQSLKAAGLKGEQLAQQPQVAALQEQLNQMKKAYGVKAPPKQAAPPLPPHIKAYSDQLNALKDSYRKAGIKGDQLVNQPQIKAMQAQLDLMKQSLTGKPPKGQAQPQHGCTTSGFTASFAAPQPQAVYSGAIRPGNPGQPQPMSAPVAGARFATSQPLGYPGVQRQLPAAPQMAANVAAGATVGRPMPTTTAGRPMPTMMAAGAPRPPSYLSAGPPMAPYVAAGPGVQTIYRR